MCLKVLSVASATLLLSLVSIHGASAEGGCGPGFHRGPRMDIAALTGQS
jgi:hypothetical protein